MFICPECEVENRSDAKFCRKCGQARVVLEQKTVTIEDSQAGFFHIESSRAGNSRAGNSRVEHSRVEHSRADSFRIESSQVEESQNNNFKSSVGSCDNSNLRIDGGASFDEAIEAVAINNDENARVSDVAGKSDQVQFSKRTDDLIRSIEAVDPPLQLSSPQCPDCQTALRSTDKYCGWCGERQPERIVPFMKICQGCNTLLPARAHFCFVCGTPTSTSARKRIRAPLELFRDEGSEYFPTFEA